MQPMKGETKRDCWAVTFGNSFNDSERIVVAGYDNGDLKMFDLRTMSLRWECNLKNGVSYSIKILDRTIKHGSINCMPSKHQQVF